MRGQLHLECPSGPLVDLHWHLVNVGRERFAAATVEGEAMPVQTLGATDTLLHTAPHVSLSGRDRLV